MLASVVASPTVGVSGSGTSGAACADAALGPFSVSMSCRLGVVRRICFIMGAPAFALKVASQPGALFYTKPQREASRDRGTPRLVSNGRLSSPGLQRSIGVSLVDAFPRSL